MSIDFTDDSEVTVEITSVEPEPTEITVTTAVDVKSEDPTGEVEVIKKEYAIISDGIFASSSIGEAPDWLTTIIDSVVDSSVDSTFQNYSTYIDDIQAAIDAIDVAEGTYVTYSNFDATIDGSNAAVWTTLNSRFETNEAQIVNIENTYAKDDAALSQKISDIAAGLDTAQGTSLDARVTEVETAYATDYGALASDLTAVKTSYEGLAKDGTANAEGVLGLQTYVGLDINGDPNNTGILARLSAVEGQTDGLVEYHTGHHAVMDFNADGLTSDTPESNSDTDNDELITTAEPYSLWTPMSGAGVPSYNNELNGRVYTDTNETYPNDEFYQVISGAWAVITDVQHAAEVETLRAQHVGDVFIETTTPPSATYVRSYKFVKTDVDTGGTYDSTDAEGYSWSLITGDAASAAAAAAQAALDQVDGKLNHYYAWGGTGRPDEPSATHDGIAYVNGVYTPSWGTTPIDASEFLYWLDGTVLKERSGTQFALPVGSVWTALPTAPGTGFYVDNGDLVTVFDPLTGDTTNYVRISNQWEEAGPTGLVANSKFFVELESNVDHISNGTTVGSLAYIEAEANSYADEAVAGAESKFAYNSTLLIDGKYYYSGFGIYSAGITQTNDGDTPGTAYDSVFWVRADEFKVVPAGGSPDNVDSPIFSTSGGQVFIGVDRTEATKNEFKGQWLVGTTYDENDLVTDDGILYISQQDSNTGNATSSTSHWLPQTNRNSISTSSSITFASLPTDGALTTEFTAVTGEVPGIGDTLVYSVVNPGTPSEDGNYTAYFIGSNTWNKDNVLTVNGDAVITGTLALDKLKASGAVQSTNFVSGTSGWYIGSDGVAEFAQIQVRAGQVSGGVSKSDAFKWDAMPASPPYTAIAKGTGTPGTFGIGGYGDLQTYTPAITNNYDENGTVSVVGVFKFSSSNGVTSGTKNEKAIKCKLFVTKTNPAVARTAISHGDDVMTYAGQIVVTGIFDLDAGQTATIELLVGGHYDQSNKPAYFTGGTILTNLSTDYQAPAFVPIVPEDNEVSDIRIYRFMFSEDGLPPWSETETATTTWMRRDYSDDLGENWTEGTPVDLEGNEGPGGLNTATVYMYQRTASETTPLASTYPENGASYDFTTGVVTGTLNSWENDIPAYTPGNDYVHVIAVYVADSSTIVTINKNDWAASALNALSAKNAAKINDIADDLVLSANEKPPLKQFYDVLIAEQPQFLLQAELYALDTATVYTDYTDAITDLNNYLATLDSSGPTNWNDFSGDTNIPDPPGGGDAREDFITTWNNVSIKRETLISALWQAAIDALSDTSGEADNANDDAGNAGNTAQDKSITYYGNEAPPLPVENDRRIDLTDGNKIYEKAFHTAGSFTIGKTYRIESTGTTDFTLIGAANSDVGTIFVATGVGSGDGTASIWVAHTPAEHVHLYYTLAMSLGFRLTIYYDNVKPANFVEYSYGDLWVKVGGGNAIDFWNAPKGTTSDEWTSTSNGTPDFTFFLDSNDPGTYSTKEYGDVWVDQDNGDRWYWSKPINGSETNPQWKKENFLSPNNGWTLEQIARQDAASHSSGDTVTIHYRNAVPGISPAPVTGDKWVDTSSSQALYNYNGSSWVVEGVAKVLSRLSTQKYNRIYYDNADPGNPSTKFNGDIWYEKDTDIVRYWKGNRAAGTGKWILAPINTMQLALDDVLATGNKIEVFFMTNEDLPYSLGDSWVDTDDGARQYTWDGNAWAVTFPGHMEIDDGDDEGTRTNVSLGKGSAAPTSTDNVKNTFVGADTGGTGGGGMGNTHPVTGGLEGGNNSGFGYGALKNLVGGDWNTTQGSGAGCFLQGLSINTAVGNTLIGAGTGSVYKESNGNVNIGYFAGADFTLATIRAGIASSNNVYMGTAAGANNSGAGNIGLGLSTLGRFSLTEIHTGSYNIQFGWNYDAIGLTDSYKLVIDQLNDPLNPYIYGDMSGTATRRLTFNSDVVISNDHASSDGTLVVEGAINSLTDVQINGVSLNTGGSGLPIASIDNSLLVHEGAGALELDPNQIGTGLTLSNDNLTATSTDAGWKSAISNGIAVKSGSGKWCFEVTSNVDIFLSNIAGIATTSTDIDNYCGFGSGDYGINTAGGPFNNNTGGTGTGFAWNAGGANPTIMVLVDLDNFTMSVVHNNSIVTEIYNSLPDVAYYPCVSVYDATNEATINYGADPFVNTIPVGYLMWGTVTTFNEVGAADARAILGAVGGITEEVTYTVGTIGGEDFSNLEDAFLFIQKAPIGAGHKDGNPNNRVVQYNLTLSDQIHALPTGSARLEGITARIDIRGSSLANCIIGTGSETLLFASCNNIAISNVDMQITLSVRQGQVRIGPNGSCKLVQGDFGNRSYIRVLNPLTVENQISLWENSALYSSSDITIEARSVNQPGLLVTTLSRVQTTNIAITANSSNSLYLISLRDGASVICDDLTIDHNGQSTGHSVSMRQGHNTVTVTGIFHTLGLDASKFDVADINDLEIPVNTIQRNGNAFFIEEGPEVLPQPSITEGSVLGVEDTPIFQLDPGYSSPFMTLSNGNLTVTHTVFAGWETVRTTYNKQEPRSRTTGGKYCFEVTNDVEGVVGDNMYVGIVIESSRFSFLIGFDNNGWGIREDGLKSHNGTYTATSGIDFSVGGGNTTVMICVDFDNGQMYAINNGNEVLLHTLPSDDNLYFPAVALNGGGAGSATINYGATPFVNTPRAQHVAWNTSYGQRWTELGYLEAKEKLNLIPTQLESILFYDGKDPSFTLDPANTSADLTLSNNNLVVTHSGVNAWEAAISVAAAARNGSGKWAFEVTSLANHTVVNEIHAGVVIAGTATNTWIGNHAGCYSISDLGHYYTNGSFQGSFYQDWIGGYDSGTGRSTVMVLLDLDNFEIGFSHAGTTRFGVMTGLADVAYYPALSLDDDGGAGVQASINYGQDAFINDLPEGYTAWNGGIPIEYAPTPINDLASYFGSSTIKEDGAYTVGTTGDFLTLDAAFDFIHANPRGAGTSPEESTYSPMGGTNKAVGYKLTLLDETHTITTLRLDNIDSRVIITGTTYPNSIISGTQLLISNCHEIWFEAIDLQAALIIHNTYFRVGITNPGTQTCRFRENVTFDFYTRADIYEDVYFEQNLTFIDCTARFWGETYFPEINADNHVIYADNSHVYFNGGLYIENLGLTATTSSMYADLGSQVYVVGGIESVDCTFDTDRGASIYLRWWSGTGTLESKVLGGKALNAIQGGGGGVFHYNTSNGADYDITRLKMDLFDKDEAYLNFEATASPDAVSAISTNTTSGATTHHIQVEINGVKAWIAVSTNDPT